jgi:hypothetical protein
MDPSLEVRLALPVCSKPVPSALKPMGKMIAIVRRDQQATPYRERMGGKVLVYPSSGSEDGHESSKAQSSTSVDLGAQLGEPSDAAITPQLGNAVRSEAQLTLTARAPCSGR